jgi:hypothetical protein
MDREVFFYCFGFILFNLVYTCEQTLANTEGETKMDNPEKLATFAYVKWCPTHIVFVYA